MKHLRFLSVLLACLLAAAALVACPAEEPPAPKSTYIALYNSSTTDEADLTAIFRIAASWRVTHDVRLLDVKNCIGAGDIYELLKAEAATLTETSLDGVQIFGTAAAVPTFFIDDKVALREGFSEERAFASDYFYSNLSNDASALATFNIADHFSQDGAVDLTPHHRVVRLPLGRGEFTSYLENYSAYLALEAVPDAVVLANPIFRYAPGSVAADDFAYFMNRAVTEWGIQSDVRLYANRKGSAPSPVAVLGDTGRGVLREENEAAVCEFFINGHGNRSELLCTVYDGAAAETQTLVSWNNINSALDDNPYFLNLWSCRAAEGLDYNLVRTAMGGKCLGAFAATASFANNGVDCTASPDEMHQSGNFFAFYHTYLSAKSRGMNRSSSFFAAQERYAADLLACSARPIDYSANYQFAYGNLLCYQNLGILEPEGEIPQSVADVPAPDDEQHSSSLQHLSVTKGVEQEEKTRYKATLVSGSGSFATQVAAESTLLDNGYVRFRVTLDANSTHTLTVVGNRTQYLDGEAFFIPKEKSITLVFDIEVADIESDGAVALFFRDDARQLMYLLEEQ